MRKTIPILVLILWVLACSAPWMPQAGTTTPLPSVAAQPTLALTATAPPVAPSATVTIEVTALQTAQGTPASELACKVLSQSVAFGSRFAAKEHFGITWMVKNTGTVTWEPGVVELAYAGGTKMYQYQPVQLDHSSPPGDIMILTADMVAPKTPNLYTMIWALRRADVYFCKMAVTIKVHL